MKKTLRLAGCAAGFAAFAVALALAQQAAAISIEFVNQFDYPGSGNQTRPQKINDKGQIAGIVVDASGVSFGFSLRGSNFSPPLIDPNDAGALTEARGINNRGIICGDYLDSAGAFEGFFFSHGTFTNYAPEPTFTIVLGINNSGDFCGSEIPSSTGVQSAFVNLGGVKTDFAIPNATATLAYQINDANQVCGYFNDENALSHGFWRDTNNKLHAPIDPAGSTTTIIFGNNDRNMMVGRFIDGAGLTHGLLFVPPNRFFVYDFPGATFTSLNGINRSNQIVGRYTDPSSGIDHGILLQVVNSGDSVELPLATTSATTRSVPLRAANTNPAY